MSPPRFSKKIAENLLVRSARHCCLCQKQSHTDIEIHHIDQNGGNDEDNGIPLCSSCHSMVGLYNDKHPRGRKYRPSELKRRRDIVFKLVEEGKLPKKHKISESRKKSLLKHSKHLLKTLYEFSDYTDLDSMIVHIDFFLNDLENRIAYQNLLLHLETGYYDDFYVPLKRYHELVLEHSNIGRSVPFHFGLKVPENILKEVESLKNSLGHSLGTLIEDVFKNDLFLEGTCPKCP